MDMNDLVRRDCIKCGMRANSKKQLLQELARLASAHTGLPERQLFDALLERERLGTTGVGGGIAIPHARLPGLNQVFGMFIRLERPVAYDAVDGQPVDLVFLLLAPESAGADHLKALARVSRLFRNGMVCETLRGGDDADALYAVLTHQPAVHAA